MTAALVTDCYRLFASIYDGTDPQRFDNDLREKQLVILLEDEDRAVRGFSTVRLEDVVHSGRRARLVYSGDTAIDPAYWGQKKLQLAFAGILLRQKLRHPGRPLLWFLISKGYKTYLLLVRHFPRSVPRCDRTQEGALEATLDRVTAQRFGDAYDAHTGVIRMGRSKERVKAGLAPIHGTLLRDPHVRFFQRANPGHEDGDELACLALVRIRDLVASIARSRRTGQR